MTKRELERQVESYQILLGLLLYKDKRFLDTLKENAPLEKADDKKDIALGLILEYSGIFKKLDIEIYRNDSKPMQSANFLNMAGNPVKIIEDDLNDRFKSGFLYNRLSEIEDALFAEMSDIKTETPDQKYIFVLNLMEKLVSCYFKKEKILIEKPEGIDDVTDSLFETAREKIEKLWPEIVYDPDEAGEKK